MSSSLLHPLESILNRAEVAAFTFFSHCFIFFPLIFFSNSIPLLLPPEARIFYTLVVYHLDWVLVVSQTHVLAEILFLGSFEGKAKR